MTAEEVFYDLYNKYGDDFNWHMIPYTNKTFVEELRKEIGRDHFLYDKRIWAVAKCDSKDDVLYLSDENTGTYYIFHLTYSIHGIGNVPKYKRFIDIKAVKDYMEQEFMKEYL